MPNIENDVVLHAAFAAFPPKQADTPAAFAAFAAFMSFLQQMQRAAEGPFPVSATAESLVSSPMKAPRLRSYEGYEGLNQTHETDFHN